MYKKLNISMDSIFIQMHIIVQEKIFLLIKSEITQVTTSVDTSMNRRNRFLQLGLHHFIPPSIDRNITRKGKLGKNTKCSKGTMGCRLKDKLQQQWTIVMLLFNSSSSMYPRGSLYSTPMG